MFAPYRHVPMFVAHQGPKPVFVRTHNDEAFWRRAFSVLLLSVLFPKLALAVLSIPILAIAAFARFTMLMMLVAAGASVLSGVAGFFCSGRRRSASACPCWSSKATCKSKEKNPAACRSRAELCGATFKSKPKSFSCPCGPAAAPPCLVPTDQQLAALYARREAERVGGASLRTTADAYHLTLAVPGFRSDDLQVDAHAGCARLGRAPRVTVVGAAAAPPAAAGVDSHATSTPPRAVERVVALPHDADPEAATVRLADGLLELTVPRVKRTISIAAPSAARPAPAPTAVAEPAAVAVAVAVAAAPAAAGEAPAGPAPSDPLLREVAPDAANIQIPDEAYESDEAEDEPAPARAADAVAAHDSEDGEWETVAVRAE
eukprot:Transcript_14538.p1 GENE.Transcript_14538~~Transcript_14538.p1  ORF type:complete len:406 (+),score=95.67 Transcript_14538:96-1220(+)